MSIRAFHFFLLAVLTLGITATAQAQAPAAATETPTYELSAGYQFLRVPEQNFPLGFAVDAARHYGALGLVGEIGWARSSEEVLGFEASANAWHFAAGGRWTGFNAGRAWPYAQVLVGAERLSFDVEGIDDDLLPSETAFIVQPGVGVTFVAGDGWGIFGQADYRRAFFEDDDTTEDDDVNNQFRVYVGLRMILD